jgi:hypothetical protein
MDLPPRAGRAEAANDHVLAHAGERDLGDQRDADARCDETLLAEPLSRLEGDPGLEAGLARGGAQRGGAVAVAALDPGARDPGATAAVARAPRS